MTPTELHQYMRDTGLSAFEVALKFANGSDWNYNMDEAPKDGTDLIGYVDETRTIITYGKVSHVPIYGWIDLTSDGPEDRDLCNPTAWKPLPAPPTP